MTPKTTTANGVQWTLAEQLADGRTVYRKGRAIKSFDAWEMERITTTGLRVDEVRTGKTTIWREEGEPESTPVTRTNTRGEALEQAGALAGDHEGARVSEVAAVSAVLVYTGNQVLRRFIYGGAPERWGIK
jgi:hypothetical protein